MNSHSIMFMTFAANDLANTADEAEKIFKIVEDNPKIKPVKVENTGVVELATIILEHFRDIMFFHFGGHADQNNVQIGDRFNLDKHKLANLLVPEHPHKLQWVFLNGCITNGHVGILTSNDIKAIIATNVEVDDLEAANMAILFYDAFFSKGLSFGDSFDFAASSITGEKANIIIVRPGESPEMQPSWTLFIHKEFSYVANWKLEQFLGEYLMLGDILRMIDEDSLDLLELLKKKDWGDKSGTFYDITRILEEPFPPHGYTRRDILNRLKMFVKNNW